MPMDGISAGRTRVLGVASAVIGEVNHVTSQGSCVFCRRTPWRCRQWRPTGRRAEATKCIDETGEPRPADAVLPAVLDPGNDRLIDAGFGFQESLRPPKDMAPTANLCTDKFEAVLFLRITRSMEPRHRT